MLISGLCSPRAAPRALGGGPPVGGAMLIRALTLSADGSGKSFGEVLCK